MKRTILSAVLIAFTFSAFAQIDHYDLAIIQSLYSKKKTDIIKSNLTFSETQSKAFWPLYDEYEAKRISLSNQRIGIINEYLKDYNSLTSEQASALMNRAFANDHSFNELEKSYFPKFVAAAGTRNAAKFYQLENYLKLIVRLKVQDDIPFIGELDKEKH